MPLHPILCFEVYGKMLPDTLGSNLARDMNTCQRMPKAQTRTAIDRLLKASTRILAVYFCRLFPRPRQKTLPRLGHTLLGLCFNSSN